MGTMWRAARGVGRVANATSKAAVRAGQNITDQQSRSRRNKAARYGVLGPGNSEPVGGVGDLLDYRGVASLNELSNLTGHSYTLGNAVDPVSWARGRQRQVEIGIPHELLRRHALVIGPSGSGKTESIIVPWIHTALMEQHTVVAIDAKGDLASKIQRYIASHGSPGAQVRRWDYGNPTESKSWNWPSSLTSDQRIDSAVVAILGRDPSASGGSIDPFFYRRDAEVLRGVLRYSTALHRGGVTAATLRRDLDQTELSRHLSGNAAFPGYVELWPLVQLDPIDFQKSVMGTRVALASISSAPIEAVTSRSEIDLERTLDEPGLFLIGSPLEGGEMTDRLSSLALSIIFQRLYERLRATQPHPHVFLFIDEASQILNRVDIARAMTQLRSAGVSIVLGFQNIEQMSNENDRATIVSNAAVQVFMRGVSEATAAHIEKRLGQRLQEKVSLSTAAQHSHRMTETHSTDYVPVIRSREILQMPFGEPSALALVTDSRVTPKPILCDMKRLDL